MIDAEVAHFWGFVVERDLVWQRRAAGYPRPWTNDLFLHEYWFTNVHRDRDTGTVWIMEHLRANVPATVGDLIFVLLCYRQLNRLETYQRFGLPAAATQKAFDAWYAPVEEFHSAGNVIGSGRHFTSIKRVKASAAEWFAGKGSTVAKNVWEAPDGTVASEALLKLKGVGPFTSLQVVADLVTTPWPGERMGRETLVPLAVGSRLALHLILTGEYRLDENTHAGNYGRGVHGEEGLTQTQRDGLVELIATQPDTLSKPMTFVDVEHSLCEWTKYRRLCSGESPQGQSGGRYKERVPLP